MHRSAINCCPFDLAQDRGEILRAGSIIEIEKRSGDQVLPRRANVFETLALATLSESHGCRTLFDLSPRTANSARNAVRF